MRRALLVPLCALSCLPGDDRPEPGTLLARAVASPAVLDGFESDDGWQITFDRFVTAVGDIRLRDFPENSESCNDYAETYYEWLFDFTKVRSPQKVGLVFGLGRCNVEFRFRAPSDETVLGLGGTEETLTFMLIEGSDLYETDSRVSLIATGRAERGAETKRFEWLFRRSYEIEECPDGSNVVDLQGGVSGTLDLEVVGQELFRTAPTDEAPIRFEPFAEADADGDGEITLAELAEAEVELDDELLPDWVPAELLPATLADLLYDYLLSRIVRVQGGGGCMAELNDRPW